MTDENVFIGKCQWCGEKVYAHPNDTPTLITEVFCSMECHNRYYELFPKTMKNEKGEMVDEKKYYSVNEELNDYKKETADLKENLKEVCEDRDLIQKAKFRAEAKFTAERERSAKLLVALKGLTQIREYMDKTKVTYDRYSCVLDERMEVAKNVIAEYEAKTAEAKGNK